MYVRDWSTHKEPRARILAHGGYKYVNVSPLLYKPFARGFSSCAGEGKASIVRGAHNWRRGSQVRIFVCACPTIMAVTRFSQTFSLHHCDLCFSTYFIPRFPSHASLSLHLSNFFSLHSSLCWHCKTPSLSSSPAPARSLLLLSLLSPSSPFHQSSSSSQPPNQPPPLSSRSPPLLPATSPPHSPLHPTQSISLPPNRSLPHHSTPTSSKLLYFPVELAALIHPFPLLPPSLRRNGCHKP